MLDKGIIPGYLDTAPVHHCHSTGTEDKSGDFRDNFLLQEQGNERKFSSTVVDLSGDWSQARSSSKWNDQLPPTGSTVSKPNQTSKLIGGATLKINDMVQHTIHALEQQQSSPTGVKTPSPIGQPIGQRVPEEHIEDLKAKAESQEVENEKLKLQHVQFLEKISGLRGRDQKLSEEAPFANVSASTAVVEIENLTGGSHIHFTDRFDENGDSKGYGFVQFKNEASAENAIDKLNGMLTTTNEDMRNITSAVVMRDEDGRSKRLGFTNCENADDAARDVETLNGKKLDDKEWAQKKSEREFELKGEFELSMKEAADKYQRANLYIKNLDDTIDEDKLKELFSEFGKITSCKVMRDPSGISRGSGFVAFLTLDEAKLVVNKPLYVALAQRKEESRAMLQAQFSQIRPFLMPSVVAPRMPMYPPSAPGTQCVKKNLGLGNSIK
ncbi:hypothetical protein Nepgr_010658 [Nepenthes gracilis]|uniref:RRM domain-containing protein n=1 Tax=Nepenthes gracilis TaxID=150966 RepID=A0AAD3XL88_NEPGR|nr:hypothetical protein Nepgr_010658 [Nepenthes gracilis]